MADLKKVLIVEDEPPMLLALTKKFEKENFQVLGAKNGEEGYKTALAKHPDLILLDLVMPKMDGMTMMKKLRKENEWGKKVPIILLTNLSADDKIMAGVVEGEPSYYLVKADWKIDDVVQKVKQRLGIIEDRDRME
jgi:DNA-binding response OmpR family regulator